MGTSYFWYDGFSSKVMTEPEINVHIEQKLKVSLNESWFRDIALETFKAEGIASPLEMGLVVTDSETIQQLNKTYRGENEPTDVLAFYMLPHMEQEHEQSFVAPPDGIHHLGEVVISYPQAVQQAREQGHSVAQELTLLVVHGVLHLLGYNHEEPEERQHMRARESEILKMLSTA
jgi:probable rRNA maturation factor